MLQQTNKQTAETKPAPESTSEYVTTIREGAIGANIFLANKKDGSQGHYFKLSRSYKGEGSQNSSILKTSTRETQKRLPKSQPTRQSDAMNWTRRFNSKLS